MINMRKSVLRAAALSLVIYPALSVGFFELPAAAYTLQPEIGQAGEIKQYSTTNCLTNQNSSGSLATCSGTYGQQLWTVEPDQTIRIWGYGSVSSGQWTAASEKCLNVPTSDKNNTGNYNSNQTSPPTIVGIHTCGVLTTDGQRTSQKTDTWEIHGESAGYATIYNIWQGKCLTTSFKIAACDASKTGQEWTLPAADSFHQTASAALGLQSMYDTSTSGGLFGDTLNPQCALQTNQWYQSGSNSLQNLYFGNCWWWSANALYAIIQFLEQSQAVGANWSGVGDLKADIANTYHAVCTAGTGGHCPVTDASSDPSPWLSNNNITTSLNHFQNDYFDATSNWGVTWLNAYKYTNNLNYLYLAENLWYFVTNNSWGYVPNGQSVVCTPGAGLVQFRHWNESYPLDNNGNTTYPDKNLGTNAWYLRLSAWLYKITGQNVYFDGIYDSSTGKYRGGLSAEAKWLLSTSGLVQLYAVNPPSTQTLPIDQQGSRFMLDGKLNSNSSCNIDRNAQKETQHEGTVLAGLATTHDAVAQATNSASPPVSLAQMEGAASYLTIADNLAETAINDNTTNAYTSPAMIDGFQVLSETCLPQGGATWPDGCDVANQYGNNNAWLPGKGIFLRGLYCVNNALQTASMTDNTLGGFISFNASEVWSEDQNSGQFADNLDQFGFLWDYDLYHGSWSEAGQGYATEESALEALSANAGLSVSAPPMC